MNNNEGRPYMVSPFSRGVRRMKDVYLLSGFLGSGKTSLLTDVIRQLKEQDLKPAVIMNELGKLAFDSQAVEEDVPLKEMLEGCICCTGAEKTEAQIQSLLFDQQFDVLLIETTGAAHPVEALDAVFSPLFAEQLNIKGIVTVADSKLWLNRSTLSPQARSLFMEQIRHAHVLLANKIDLLSEEEQAQVVYELQSFNPRAMLLQTTNGRVPIQFLQQMQSMVQPAKDEIVLAQIGGSFNLGSRLVQFTQSYSEEEFEAWVRALPETVYRMKGYVPITGVRNPMLFQYAYGMVQWLPEYIKMEPKLVIIGENIADIAIIGE